MKDDARRGALAVARVPAGAVPAAATPPNAPETRTASGREAAATPPDAPEPRTANEKKDEKKNEKKDEKKDEMKDGARRGVRLPLQPRLPLHGRTRSMGGRPVRRPSLR
jgi:hypothetical protein